MKRKVFLVTVYVIFNVLVGYSQSPELFNYQAVLRNSSGELITSQSVEVQISIIDNNAGGAVLYTETHTKTTNAYGLVNLVIGTGEGTDDFSAIDWAADKRFIGVKVDIDSEITDLGAFQLLSVPYALHANSASNLGSDNIYIPQPDTLFAVKDHDGNVVFAVFPDGVKVIVEETTKGTVGGFAVSGRSPTKVGETDIFRVTPDSTRIFVNDTIQSKGRVGGFAVSGRSPTKGITSEYLVVTQDSTRVYISDTTLAKGRVGGFAVSGRSPTKAETKDYFNISGNSEVETVNSDARILWYPKKEAFLTGRVLVESPDSVGTNSMATGYESKAIGDYSQAMGYKAIARGDYSTAIGDSTYATGNSSYAFGNNAFAKGESSFALGSGAEANGKYSFAFGGPGQIYSYEIHDWVPTDAPKATADYAYALGMGCVSNSEGAVSFGTQDTASGQYATAFGFQTVAKGSNSTAMGYGAIASGQRSFSVGFFSKATALYSIAMGSGPIASGGSAIAIGSSAIASGGNSVALGGFSPTARGSYTYALGFRTIARSQYETVVGMFNDTTLSTDMSQWIETDPIFIIGNGYYENPNIYRKNAMVVKKNGEVYFPDVYSDAVGALPKVLYIDNTGKIGYLTSSKRYKEQIEDMENVEWLYKLRPVNYLYKNDKNDMKQYGLIAEEVEEVNPLFVSYNKEGKIETVSYSKLVSPMLKALQEQNVEIEQLKSENQELKQKLDEIIELLNK